MKKYSMIAVTVVMTALFSGCVRMAVVKQSYERSPSLPVLDGRVQAPGLNGPVDIYRDQYGVPHIFTEDERDLYFAIGYVQAQDRLWEMMLLRAVAEGRLAELFGDVGVPGGPEIAGFVLSTTGMDRRQRTLGMKFLGEVGEALIREADPAMAAQLQAYCDGVNSFIAAHDDWKELPIEFQVLRVKPEPVRVADLVSANLMLGQMLAGNMDKELQRYAFFKKYGEDLGWKLMPLHDSLGPTIVPPEMLANKLAVARDLPPGGRPSAAELGYTFDDLAGGPSADAAERIWTAEVATKTALFHDYPWSSNNWIIGPKLSASGNAMLANDPHLEHLQPSLLYLMHIHGAGFDCAGATFPGMPFLVLAHTRKLAWGETTTAADVQDLYIETTDRDHPGMYQYKGEWRPFTVREEIIRVKVPGGFLKKKVTIRQSIHGPIINDMTSGLDKDTPPIALRWVAWDLNRDLGQFEKLISSATVEDFMAKLTPEEIKAARLMSGAHMFNLAMKGASIEDFRQALDSLVLPNQNWVAADSDGHIMYLPGGLIPVRNKGLGVMPVPGASGEFDWTGFIPLMELPHAIDPERGYMATANNEVVDAQWYPYVFATDYGDGWRAGRIEELIQELAPLTVDDMKRIQNDVQVKEAAWLVPKVLAAVDRLQPADPKAVRAADELRAWNFEADLDSTAVVIFYQLTREIRRNILEDELPDKGFSKYGGGSSKIVNVWIERGESEFFDDKRTPAVETLDDILVRSLADAMAAVEKEDGKDPAGRRWGKLHYLKWYHPLGWGPLADLSVGPYPHLGGSQTVRNAGSAGFGRDPWKALGGPVLRHIIDMGDPDHSAIVIDGSQSGQWLSPHYDDMHPLFINSQYINIDMRPEEAKTSAVNHLTLEP